MFSLLHDHNQPNGLTAYIPLGIVGVDRLMSSDGVGYRLYFVFIWWWIKPLQQRRIAIGLTTNTSLKGDVMGLIKLRLFDSMSREKSHFCHCKMVK